MANHSCVCVNVLDLDGATLSEQLFISRVPAVGEIVRAGSFVYRVRVVEHCVRSEWLAGYDAILWCEHRYGQGLPFSELVGDWPR